MGTLNIAGMDFDLGQPKSAGSGDRFNKADHEGQIVLFIEPEAKDVDSQYGTSTAAACDFVIAFAPNGEVVYEDALIFGAALAPSIYDAGSRVVAGRLGRASKAKAGRSRAWILDPLSDDERAEIEAWAKTNLSVTNGRVAFQG